MLEDRIHTTVKRTLVYKFQNEIKKGKCYSFHLVGVASNIGGFKTNHHPYKLIFQFSTKVILLEDGAVPNIVYDLVPISTIMDGGLDVDYLVGKVALLNSINFDLIIISTIMLLWYLLDKISWDCWLVLEMRENEKDDKKTKMNVIQLEDERYFFLEVYLFLCIICLFKIMNLCTSRMRIKCTLFGEYVDKLNASLLLEKVQIV